MEKLTVLTENIMNERFGKDNVIALATAQNNVPYVRGVNAYYENGAFYVITYLLSEKMKQLSENPHCAISGEWFTASGIGENLGWFRAPENEDVAERLRNVFSEWIDNGHNNFDDPNCIILRIKLKNGVLFSNGTRYDIDFEE